MKLKYKFEIVLNGIQFDGRVFYGQNIESGIKRAEKKIRELQSDFNGDFNKEALLYIFQLEENGKFRWIDTKRFDPIKKGTK